ncbi:hypothetical protein CAEBREN_05751 [Caenorhabditis brenneri]|nr:hypothetical protein CAEBREN_05751 [Caenorhabditis brenneri]
MRNRIVKQEESSMDAPSPMKKYIAVKPIPNNGQKIIRTMNGQIVKVVSKTQPVMGSNSTATSSILNSDGKKIYFIRSKTGVPQRIQNPL